MRTRMLLSQARVRVLEELADHARASLDTPSGRRWIVRRGDVKVLTVQADVFRPLLDAGLVEKVGETTGWMARYGISPMGRAAIRPAATAPTGPHRHRSNGELCADPAGQCKARRCGHLSLSTTSSGRASWNRCERVAADGRRYCAKRHAHLNAAETFTARATEDQRG